MQVIISMILFLSHFFYCLAVINKKLSGSVTKNMCALSPDLNESAPIMISCKFVLPKV